LACLAGGTVGTCEENFESFDKISFGGGAISILLVASPLLAPLLPTLYFACTYTILPARQAISKFG